MQLPLLKVVYESLRWLIPRGIPQVDECILISRVFPTMSFFLLGVSVIYKRNQIPSYPNLNFPVNDVPFEKSSG